MKSNISNNFNLMYKDYLKAYYKYKGHIKYALKDKTFFKRIENGEVITVNNEIEFMSNKTFNNWLSR